MTILGGFLGGFVGGFLGEFLGGFVYVDVLNVFLRPAINVGVASMKFSHSEAFPCLSAGGYSTDKSTANNSKNPQRHPPRNPQLNQQISTAKSTAEAGRRGGGVRFVPLSGSLGG